MRFASRVRIIGAVLAMCAAAVGQQKINPATQINWPAGCQVYNVAQAACPPVGIINFRGTWSSATTYALNDAVFYNGSQYVSIQNNNLNNIPSTATTFWALFSEGATAAGGNFAIQYANNAALAGANFTGLVQNNGSSGPPSLATAGTVATALGGTPALLAANNNYTGNSSQNATVAATVSTNQPSPSSSMCGNAWNGSASLPDCVFWRYVLPPFITTPPPPNQGAYTLTHTGPYAFGVDMSAAATVKLSQTTVTNMTVLGPIAVNGPATLLTTNFGAPTTQPGTVNVSSPAVAWNGQWTDGTTLAPDRWVWNSSLPPSGTNPTSTYFLVHSGTPGAVLVNIEAPVAINNGSNVIFRCTTAGTLRVGQLTSVSADCGASVDSGLRTN